MSVEASVAPARVAALYSQGLASEISISELKRSMIRYLGQDAVRADYTFDQRTRWWMQAIEAYERDEPAFVYRNDYQPSAFLIQVLADPNYKRRLPDPLSRAMVEYTPREEIGEAQQALIDAGRILKYGADRLLGDETELELARYQETHPELVAYGDLDAATAIALRYDRIQYPEKPVMVRLKQIRAAQRERRARDKGLGASNREIAKARVRESSIAYAPRSVSDAPGVQDHVRASVAVPSPATPESSARVDYAALRPPSVSRERQVTRDSEPSFAKTIVELRGLPTWWREAQAYFGTTSDAQTELALRRFLLRHGYGDGISSPFLMRQLSLAAAGKPVEVWQSEVVFDRSEVMDGTAASSVEMPPAAGVPHTAGLERAQRRKAYQITELPLPSAIASIGRDRKLLDVVRTRLQNIYPYVHLKHSSQLDVYTRAVLEHFMRHNGLDEVKTTQDQLLSALQQVDVATTSIDYVALQIEMAQQQALEGVMGGEEAIARHPERRDLIIARARDEFENDPRNQARRALLKVAKSMNAETKIAVDKNDAAELGLSVSEADVHVKVAVESALVKLGYDGLNLLLPYQLSQPHLEASGSIDLETVHALARSLEANLVQRARVEHGGYRSATLSEITVEWNSRTQKRLEHDNMSLYLDELRMFASAKASTSLASPAPEQGFAWPVNAPGIVKEVWTQVHNSDALQRTPELALQIHFAAIDALGAWRRNNPEHWREAYAGQVAFLTRLIGADATFYPDEAIREQIGLGYYEEYFASLKARADAGLEVFDDELRFIANATHEFIDAHYGDQRPEAGPIVALKQKAAEALSLVNESGEEADGIASAES